MPSKRAAVRGAILYVCLVDVCYAETHIVEKKRKESVLDGPP